MKMKIRIGEHTFEVEVGDLQARPILATVDGETFEVMLDEASQPVAVAAAPAPVVAAPAAPRPAPAAHAPAAGGASGKVVPAPIPGVIVAVTVKPGDAIKAGQELLTLEAMKMKNAIRSNRDGVIASVLVAVGDHVKHGQPLVEFSE